MLTLLTLTFHFQIQTLFGIKQQKYSTEFQADPHNTKLGGYRHLHLQHPHIPSTNM